MASKTSNPKNQTPFYSRWWGNITNYLEGWKNYFWDMFNHSPSQETPTEINEPTTRVTETATALSGFARQFRIQREGNYDEIEFMQIVKPDVLRIMRQNRQTRMRLILNCYMTRTDLTNGNIIDAYPYFHSQTIENLGALRPIPVGDHEGINESEIIDSMIETIEERFQNFTNR